MLTPTLCLRASAMLPLLLPLLLSIYATNATARFPRGAISPLLHEQALSHIAFHSPVLKYALARLFPASRAVAVVGVEWGAEVQQFADRGFHVYAFEPGAKFVRHLRHLLERNPAWNVTVLPIAAGNTSAGYIDLEYGNEDVRERVPVGKVDDHVAEPLAVFSLDIQGDELFVLQGSNRTLSQDVGVYSLWVEAIACNPNVPKLLQLLDERYVMFDFVPWGKHLDDSSNSIPSELNSFAFDPQRPAEFHAYLTWMCEEKEERYKWLQTDFLAVRRDLVDDALVKSLKNLADEHCGGQSEGADCALRSLLLSDSEKDEL